MLDILIKAGILVEDDDTKGGYYRHNDKYYVVKHSKR